MLNHLPFAKLADLSEGRLGDAERSGALAHVAGCRRCSAKLEKLESVITLMRTDAGEDAPRDLVAGAIGLFRRSPGAQSEPSVINRIVAALSFDSLKMSPAFGVRSGTQAAARQMLFSAGDADLDLRLTRSGEEWVISGQVLGQQEECAGGTVILSGPAGEARARLNEQCEFTLSPVSHGVYNLSLRLSGAEVVIPEIELKA